VADVGVVRSDELIVALIVPMRGSEPTEDELLAFARAGLASHQAPDAIRFVEALPRNSVGKLIRGELSRLAAGPASEARR
jgi:long-chain acyl-CoA synthetase